ncbi:MAG: hypothetical protein NC541_03690 [bacterium]|nr:hypothetical protein [bacterium]
MDDRQKQLMDFLEKIGEAQEKKRNKKQKTESIVDGGKQIEELLRVEGLIPRESEIELTEPEIEKLKDACLKLREDGVETINVSTALNALCVSVLSLILSASATVMSLVKDVHISYLFVAVFAGLSIVAIIGIVFALFLFCGRIKGNAKRADRYRNAYIELSLMQKNTAV